MKDQKIPQIKILFTFFLSVFGIGLLPIAPGTWASLFTLPLLYFLGINNIPVFFLIPITVILTIVACFVTDIYQKKFHVHDPPWIVIDEVLGMMVTWFFWPSPKISSLLMAFALFRFFDIVKIWPANWLDKKVQHGAGTILDDIISGIYAGVLLWLLQKFLITP